MSYPLGTYATRVHHGQPVESEPLPGALVAMPGPLHSDLQFDGNHREDSFALLEEVKDALSDEASAIAEEYELSTTTSPAKISVPVAVAQGDEPEGDPEERPTVVVRHRFERRTTETAKRIVVLRDRRRGRPSTRHGSDPPG